MQQFKSSHSNETGSEHEAKSSPSGPFWRFSTLAVLVCLLLAGRYMVPADQFASADVTIAPMGEFSTDGYQVVQQANILQDVIDFFQEIIDILEGRTPGSTQQDPEPDDPITTDEEREDINDAVDEAEDEGVDVPEERVEANWSYKEVEGFLLLMIDLIEDYMQNGSE